MPFYEVQHTLPLTAAQKQALAKHITDLHSTTFVVPTLFVNIVFKYYPGGGGEDNNSTASYFLAGRPTAVHPAGPNRIFAMVRQGPKRTKAVFDELARRIEDAWDEVAASSPPPPGAAPDSKAARKARKLHIVTFYGLLAAREAGTVIPDAGNEATWLKDNMPYFKSMAYDEDDDDFKQVLEEVESRDDLKALI